MKLKTNFVIAVLLFGIIACSSKEDEIIITIDTTDLNVNIDENPMLNQTIGKVEGTTNGGALSFSIISQKPNDAFAVNNTTGEISVLNEILFDFEINPVITGVVKVSNGEISSFSTVTITINDIEEGVFNGDVVLTTQKEIDDFGANNYIAINGNLTIHEDQTIHDIAFLSSLSSITSISGVLKIQNMFNLLDIPNFENLTSVGGIIIVDNSGILDFNSFSNITNCNGSITILNNTSLGYFCGIRPLLQSGNFTGTYTVSGNSFNPTQQDIIDGNCEK